ncbi:MAG: hypothetical protein KAI24_13570 [Planctomycetes bacterium]|nr:hypothetical protein [Planctomycetota bacterium]
MPDAPPTASRRTVALCALGWGLLAAGAFAGTLHTAFVQDDFWLLEALGRPMPNRAMLAGTLPDYVRPLPTWWLPWCNAQLWGLDARGHHLSLLLLHGAVTATWFVALWRWTGSLLGASFGAALYGLCEVHLVTLGWIAGAGDPLCSLGLAAAMVALARPDARAWPAMLAWLFALLAKEHAIVLAAAFAGTWLVQRCAREPAPLGGRRHLLAFAITGASYAVYWLLIAQRAPDGAGGTFGFDPLRAALVLRHSVLVVHPTIDHGEAIADLWVLAPPLIGAITLALGGRAALRDVTFALLLWGCAAALFAFTTRPTFLEQYYANFSVVGLALLAARLVACVQARTRGRAAHVVTAVLLALYASTETVARIGDVDDADTPSLRAARISAAFAATLAEGLRARPARHVVVLDATADAWWATGKGAQVDVLHPGTTVHFVGHDAGSPPPADDALVLRQTGERAFAVVRQPPRGR